jgi:polyphenol oxidase
VAVLVAPVDLRPDVGAWFTGRDRDAGARAIGSPGNLAHRRPHLPSDLARDRGEVAEIVDVPASRWHLMRQVHGAEVALVDHDTPPGSELGYVDAAVTAQPDRALVVQVADCVPVLFAGSATVGVAHAGRRGVQAGVVEAAVARLAELGDPPGDIVAAIGPAIGGCCYEVPGDLRDAVVAEVPSAEATTTWGTPSLDLPSAVRAQLEDLGVEVVAASGGCTRCDPDRRWFSHRGDPDAGRQIGLVVRRSAGADEAAA